MRKQFVLLHRWLGLIAGAVVFLVCLSGSLLVFEEPIENVLNGRYLQSLPIDITWQQLSEAAQAQLRDGESLRRLYLPPGRVQVRGRGGNRDLFFSTQDATYLGEGTRVMEQVLNLHRRLLLGNVGRWFTLTSCLFFLGLMTSGIKLWLPAKWSKWKSGFQIQSKASRRRFMLDLHRVVGICVALPFLMVALTGLNYSLLSKPLRAMVLAVTAAGPEGSPAVPSQPLLDRPLTLDGAVEVARAVFPEAQLSCLETMEKPSGCLKVRFHHPGQLGEFGQSFVMVYLPTGEVLQTYNAVQQGLGRRMVTEWALPLHRGEAFGLVHRLLWVLLALAGALMPVTGYWLWWKKKK